jgi:RHS repeat-associated protein
VDRTHFVWNGWLLQAELDGASGAGNSLRRAYVWGTDLSGSLEGAGAVGGLLWQTTDTQAHFSAYDGNGNIAALVADDGEVSAEYDYGPFGQLLEQHGPYATENRFRFSTKWEDAESGLYYYGFRYYNPSTGRWLSRDPIEERGGKNLYGFLGNNGINRVDLKGLLSVDLTFSPETPQKMPYTYAAGFTGGGTIGGTDIDYDVDCKCIQGELKCKVKVKYKIYVIRRDAFDPPLSIIDVAKIYGHEQQHVRSFSIEARIVVNEIISAYQGSNSTNPSPVRNSITTGLKNAKEREGYHRNPGSPESGDARFQNYWPMQGFAEFSTSVYHD